MKMMNNIHRMVGRTRIFFKLNVERSLYMLSIGYGLLLLFWYFVCVARTVLTNYSRLINYILIGRRNEGGNRYRSNPWQLSPEESAG